ncbi:MAG: hypothetical protein E6J47_02740, partial [Chloroflexi bacterium]
MIVHRRPSRLRRLAFGGPAISRLASGLGARLDDRFHFLANVPAGGRTPLDAVVVGPGGTWAISVHAEPGRFRKRNGHWYRWNRATESWVPWEAESISAARLAGHRLERYLERAMLPGAVEACLLARRGVQIDWEADQRPGVQIERDVEVLAARIGREKRLSTG